MDVLPTILLRRGVVEMIDQTLLPLEYKILQITTVKQLCEAIQSLRIRGAPALGIAAAFGMLMSLEEEWGQEGSYYFDMVELRLDSLDAAMDVDSVREHLNRVGEQIRLTRPTAVNLGWAVDRMLEVCNANHSLASMLTALHKEAVAIFEEDLAMCRAIGDHGAKLIHDGDGVLTHCNTGGLATSGFGTALGVVFAAVAKGKKVMVYADETRPLLQGARLNTWECEQRGIPVSVLCDGAAASVLSRGLVSCVIVGADRIAANGDTANKIGTLNLAIVADHYGIPFYVAAPTSTIDMSITSGSEIPIEERAEGEVKSFSGVRTVPESARAVNPAFDITPRQLIAGFITEHGVVTPPFLVSASAK